MKLNKPVPSEPYNVSWTELHSHMHSNIKVMHVLSTFLHMYVYSKRKKTSDHPTSNARHQSMTSIMCFSLLNRQSTFTITMRFLKPYLILPYWVIGKSNQQVEHFFFVSLGDAMPNYVVIPAQRPLCFALLQHSALSNMVDINIVFITWYTVSY
jgi:hypothetical protein